MRERIIDLALIGGLVVVAVVIVFTLFSPLPPRSQVERGPLPDEVTDPLNPEAPGDEAASGPDISPVTPDADAGGDAAGADAEPAADEEGEPETPDAAPLPAGAVDLERIGFSFATGGEGACGTVLEPWLHVAVSRDILARYPCGSELTVALDEEVAGRGSVQVVVGDTMGSSFSRTVNIYVGPDEPAFEYGVQTGRLEP